MPKIYLTLLITSLLCTGVRADVNLITTIKPLQMIAEAVLLDRGSVSSIVDPRQSAHHFNISPSARMALARADLAIWIGPQFETHISDFFAQAEFKAKSITVVDIPDLQLYTIGGGQLDAHLWLDSSNALRIAGAIVERAMLLDPDNASYYRKNLENFGAGVERTNNETAQLFRTAPTTTYAVFHNAYQYFEKQFGLHHDMVILDDPEIQPGIREIVGLRNQINNLQPSCLFLEFDSSPELVRTVLDGHVVKLVTVDLLGSDVSSGENAYSEFVANIATDFYQCLYE